jgi:hypothetical protein
LNDEELSFPPEYGMNFEEIVEYNGLVYGEYMVTTKDGYELKVCRI